MFIAENEGLIAKNKQEALKIQSEYDNHIQN